MGAPTAQVQSSQTSQPAGKGAGDSPSSETKSISLSGLSGQPAIGQPNTNGNTGLAPVNPTYGDGSPSGKGGQAGQPQTATSFVAQQDGATNANPYPNTVGQISNQSMKTPAGKGKGA
jgi:hypothetical protein